jgi:hypothetical protein
MQRKRARTHDLAGVGGIHTVEQIGPKRHRTPEGYLLCEDVCLARTGTMMYGRGETPIKTNDMGIAYVSRDERTLFHPVTIMSFSGKSVTNNHPPGGVTPHNYKQVTVGTVLNVRRGTGDDADTLRGDLLITDAQAIRDVEAGKREVSPGYDADYQTTGPAEGRQVHIVGNHVALVDKGRCGPRCHIGDHALISSTPKGKTMPTTTRRVSDAQRAAVMTALGIGDEDETQDEGEGNHIHVHLDRAGTTVATGDAQTLDAVLEARISGIEDSVNTIASAVAALVKSKTGDGGQREEEEDEDEGEEVEEENGMKSKKDQGKKVAGTGDSAALATSYTALLADAEVLVPGFKVPTFDAKADRKATVDRMCAIRRRALDSVNTTQDGSVLLRTVSGGQTIDTMSMDCKAVATIFRAAAGAKRLLNNSSSMAGSSRVADGARPAAKKGPQSIAELQAMNRKEFPLG